MTIEASGPNAEQIQYWNETAGPRWVAQQEFLDSQLQPLGLKVMDRAAVAAGQHVLDVGCGCGATTRELARRVGSGGSVTGVDVSATMLKQAQQLAQQAGLKNIRFENADAQTHRFAGATFDLLFSRFGVMFFVDPQAAFTNLAAALRPGGRLAFICWQQVQDNPWMFVPFMAALQHIPPPSMPAPGAPGPFAFADRDRVTSILSGAGFVDLAFEDLREQMVMGAGAPFDEVIDVLMQIGPLGRALVEAEPGLRAKVQDAVKDSLRPYFSAEGLRMDSAAWIVTARRV